MSGSLRDVLAASDSPVMAPGAFDGASARLIDLSGFSAVYASGGAISRAAGYPDIGLLDLTEVASRIANIVDATSLPVIADAETGFGGCANVQRTARIFEKIGVSAFHIEDQKFPKRCGALPGKSLISVDEMCNKIEVARESVSSQTMVIARTDSLDVEGLDSAVARSRRYMAAGADMLFVCSMKTANEFERVGTEVPGPKLISNGSLEYGGKLPVSMPRAAELGYELIIASNFTQRVALKAIQRALKVLREDGHVGAIEDDMITMAEREEISATDRYFALEWAVDPA